MTTESLEELRERLIRQKSVQEMIQIRAYEIYQMRGGQPGGEAQDWFHAESEVLAFLLASESANEYEGPGQPYIASPTPESSIDTVPTKKVKKPGTRTERKPAEPKKTTPKKATPKQTAARPSSSKRKTKRTSSQTRTEESGQ